MVLVDRLSIAAVWRQALTAGGLFTMLLAGALATVTSDVFGQS